MLLRKTLITLSMPPLIGALAGTVPALAQTRTRSRRRNAFFPRF